MLQISDGILL